MTLDFSQLDREMMLSPTIDEQMKARMADAQKRAFDEISLFVGRNILAGCTVEDIISALRKQMDELGIQAEPPWMVPYRPQPVFTPYYTGAIRVLENMLRNDKNAT